MQKGWSVFFGVVLLSTFLMWFVAPFFGWWMPENVSSYGGAVDGLFYLILAMTGVFFVLTEVVLVYAMWRFAARPGEKSEYTHGNNKLEVIWTVIPAVLLILIAVVQIPAWASMKIYAWDRIKKPSTSPPPSVVVAVSARQWEWRMRYPAVTERFKYSETSAEDEIKASQRDARTWADNAESDDLHVPNELHCWKDADVKIYLKTLDVLHSFTVPNLRLKQDTLPGKTIPVWFKAEKANCRFDAKTGKIVETGDRKDAWEIACQELCGGRHYAMRGRFFVHESRASYLAWLDHAKKQQNARAPQALSKAD